MGNVILSGYSRGGTVALLFAERDSRVRTVIAGGGPTDFYRAAVRERYHSQYACQFVTNKTDTASRFAMLASSPLRFPMLKSVRKVHLFHGDQDDLVPPWNAVEMQAHLTAQGVNSALLTYPANHGTVWDMARFNSDWEMAHTQAMQPVK